MKQTKKFLASTAETLDLPADIFAGLPKMELTGSMRFSMEPHRGLLEYSEELVSVDSVIGKVSIAGKNLNIQQMNRSRITVSGSISSVKLEEVGGE